MMVGLPFPNPHSPDMAEKMRFVDAQHRADASLPTGKEYYENVCMRAVNQSIGRAIRHKNDYACVVLLDARYGQKRIRQKLPAWMSETVTDLSTEKTAAFGHVCRLIAGFFRGKNG